MRIAVVLLYAHFFISGAIGHPADANTLHLDITDARCTKIVEPLIVVAQLYDVVNTRNHLRKDPAARETDWWTAQFAGPQGRSTAGIAFGIALLDAIKWRLTAHSAALRCVVEMDQLETTMNAIHLTERP